MQCNCDDIKHKTCQCRHNYCDCLIENKIKPRIRCPVCRTKVITDIFSSKAGWFLGYLCNKCGLIGRISDFADSHDVILKHLIERQPTAVDFKIMAYLDYQDGIVCFNCSAQKYEGYISLAIKQTMLTPLEDYQVCVKCGK